jgi:hypothetical protein
MRGGFVNGFVSGAMQRRRRRGLSLSIIQVRPLALILQQRVILEISIGNQGPDINQ